MLPTWMHWVAIIFAAAIVTVPAYRWAATSRAYGSVPLRLAMNLLQYTWVGRNKRYLLAAARVGILLVLLLLAGLLPASLAIIIVSLVVAAILGFSLPPAVLFLGPSSAQTALLMEEIDKAIYPLRVVALLDPSDANWTVKQNIAFDNLRTKKDDVWRSVVHPLMDSSLLVVVDARVGSPAVVEEAVRVLKSPDRAKRAIFVQGENHERGAINAIALYDPDNVGVEFDLASIRLISVDKAPFLVRRVLGR